VGGIDFLNDLPTWMNISQGTDWKF